MDDRLGQATDGTVYPGMMFSLAKERMEDTRLWKIVRKMPKGALLHSHMEAMVDLDWIIDRLLATPDMHVFASEPLVSEEARQRSSVEFTYAASPADGHPSIWTSDYRPSSLVPVTIAADTFPDGGRAAFQRWLKGRCSISVQESLEHQLGIDAIWRKFFSTFGIIGTIVWYEPIFRAFVHRMCRQLLDDGVRWVDLRIAFVFRYRRTGAKEPEGDYMEVMRVLAEEVENFKSSEDGKGFWGARVIWTTLRALPTTDIVQSMPSRR